ncbi:MAG TPA: tyrosine-type recombinase/integrase, partial [Leptolinea sp.]
TEETVAWMINRLKDHAPSTERLYLTATTGFFEFLASENLATINLPRIQMLIHQRARRPGQRLPMFPRDNIDTIVEHMLTKSYTQSFIPDENLRNLRDRAFLITLADTGLRVHEACGLRRGDIDWNEGRAIVIGKGNRQAVVRFSSRSMDAIKQYLSARASTDGSTGKPLASLPVFARHDKGAGRKIKPITTTTGREIVNNWVNIILGPEAVGTITPHSFRHYFVTRVLHSSGNLKLAQELARHKSIAVTQRYAHLNDDELDRGYYDIFEQTSRKTDKMDE